jgi:hypothetical protein
MRRGILVSLAGSLAPTSFPAQATPIIRVTKDPMTARNSSCDNASSTGYAFSDSSLADSLLPPGARPFSGSDPGA